MHPQCACTCVTVSRLKVLLIESLGLHHSAVNARISVIAAPSKNQQEERFSVQKTVQNARKKACYLIVASPQLQYEDTEAISRKKRLITAKRSPPAEQHLCKLPRKSWLLSVWRPRACTRSGRCVTLTCSAPGCLSWLRCCFFSQSGLVLVRVMCILQGQQICSVATVWPCTLKDFNHLL